MVSLVQRSLIPMDLKKYLVVSFITLWTAALIISLVATIIHQVNFQDSSGELNLNLEISHLEHEVMELNLDKEKMQSTINKLLNEPYYE